MSIAENQHFAHKIYQKMRNEKINLSVKNSQSCYYDNSEGLGIHKELQNQINKYNIEKSKSNLQIVDLFNERKCSEQSNLSQQGSLVNYLNSKSNTQTKIQCVEALRNDQLNYLKKQLFILQKQQQQYYLMQNKIEKIEEEIKKDQHNKNHLYQRITSIKQNLSILYQQYSINMSNENNWKQQMLDYQKNIEEKQQEVVILRNECQQKMKEKQKLDIQFKKIKNKKSQFLQLFDDLNNQFSNNQKQKIDLENQITFLRQKLELLQEQQYLLEQKYQNLKKYGYETIPQNLIDLQKEKDFLETQISQYKKLQEIQKQDLNKLVPLNIYQNLQQQIVELKRKKQKNDRLKKQNQNLAQKNFSLNVNKYDYQWNPNIEIQKLQANLKQQEYKINLIQKQILNLRKKSTQINKKLSELKKNQQISNTSEINFNLKQAYQKDSKKAKIQTEKNQNRSLYEDIRFELQKENLLNGKSKNRQNVDGKNKFKYFCKLIYKGIKKDFNRIFFILLATIIIICVCYHKFITR